MVLLIRWANYRSHIVYTSEWIGDRWHMWYVGYEYPRLPPGCYYLSE